MESIILSIVFEFLVIVLLSFTMITVILRIFFERTLNLFATVYVLGVIAVVTFCIFLALSFITSIIALFIFIVRDKEDQDRPSESPNSINCPSAISSTS